jgi:Phosphotransferase enzyme family
MTGTLSADEIAFLGREGFTEPSSVVPVRGGANNRIFRVEGGGRSAVLKRYFRSPSDPRDRFGAEQNFYAHAARVAPEFVPQALGWAREISCGLFAYVPGSRLRPEDVDRRHVMRAAEFIARLNAEPETPFAPASDAAFSVAENRASIQRRIDRLAEIQPETESHRQAIDLVHAEVLPAWTGICCRDDAGGWPDDGICQAEERVISPSDFGFHNALMTDDGSVLFLDFEYAGADDPAKMIGDFFGQPEIPVPGQFFPEFSEAICAFLPKARRDACRSRVARLRPLITLKWCCIMLNDFLPVDQARRVFALSEVELQARRQRQVARVAEYLRKNLE